jgi:OPA family glycerol-3-phosphate transporter-like MFS transporter
VLLDIIKEYYDMAIVSTILTAVIILYFRNNPLKHGKKFMLRRFINWFPLGMTYAFLYMARYNLSVSKNALGDLMTKESFGIIFGAGTIVYGLSFLLNGPLVDKIGGKRGIVIAALGSCIMNALMGGVTYLYLKGLLNVNLTLTFAILYSLNMFFQSYGAVAIIKVKAYWFHVRERGVFGAIFGTLISFGVYFAFDWGQAIVEAVKLNPDTHLNIFQQFIRSAFAVEGGTHDAVWLVFMIPSGFLVIWALIDMMILKDSPADANFGEFETHDASSDEVHNKEDYSISALIKWIFKSPIMLTIAAVEFTSGVLRNGIMQWYFVYAKEIPQIGAEFIKDNWGLLLMLTGVSGGFVAGWVSDHLYHSRRGPPAAINNLCMLVLTIIMAVTLGSNPLVFGIAAVMLTFFVIGVHSLMSGTAAADFGGKRKTATASGIVDGFVYLGSGLQSISLGFLTSKDWLFWPVFLLPFTIMGLFFSAKLWFELPAATKRYLKDNEGIDMDEMKKNRRRFRKSK